MKRFQIEKPVVEIEYITLPDYFTTQAVEGGAYKFHRATDTSVVTLQKNMIQETDFLEFCKFLLTSERESIQEIPEEQFLFAFDLATDLFLNK